jgi:TPR repeat protein
MLKGLQTLLITLALCVGTVWAGDFEDGEAAILKGEKKVALDKYKRAAAQGDVRAYVLLGHIYDWGQGVAEDHAEAARWFRLAAIKGNASGQFNIGFMYAKGRGVVQDYSEAVRWYKLAAEQGYAVAQNGLGYMYRKGQGLAQDYVRAHMWYNLAAIKGDYKIAVENRDNIASEMTSQQIAEAQKLARECQARNFKNCD